MSKSLSAKYYQENKERLQKKFMKDLSKAEKEKSNMIMNDTKIYQKMKNKSLLSLEKNIIE